MQIVEAVVLAGKWVRLEPLELRHAPGLWRAASADRATYGWTEVPDSEAEATAYIERALTAKAQGSALPFATVDAATGEVVGSTRFGNIERWAPWPPHWPQSRPAGCTDAVEIGWTWLAAAAQRTPINTEAKRLMLAHAFERWEVHRVTLKTDGRNARSRAAIERLGATLDGLLRAHMPAADGTLRTSAVYSILAPEWPAVRARLDAKLSG